MRSRTGFAGRRRCVMISIATAIALGIFGGAARAQSVGELSPGMMMNKGWYAIAVPPIQVIDGRRVVAASAPESEWIVKLGPFLDLVPECSRALSGYARGSLSDEEIENFKVRGGPSAEEARVLAEIQQRNARCVISDGSERFRTPGRFATDPTTDFVR